MKIDDIYIADLLHKQQIGLKLSLQEQQELNAWLAASDSNLQLYEQITHRKFSREAYEVYFQAGNAQDSWDKIVEQSGWKPDSRRIGRRVIWMAASVIILLGVGGVWFFLNPSVTSVIPVAENNIAEEKPHVVLTLSDGQTIPLNQHVGDSAIVEKAGATILSREGNLRYTATAEVQKLAWNKIEVPRGGEYQLTLADGTKVWLNSDSRLVYPVTFSGTTRELTLEGEAYFEVARDTALPFIVHTSGLDVRVLGTEFNVRTYAKDYQTATLVKGKVQLECGGEVCQLRPGQQGCLVDHKLQIREVNLETVTAWRNAVFDFRECPLEDILCDLARWYDLEVFYQNPEVKNYHFTAWFYRNDSIQQVISLLEKTNKIKMKINGKTLMVEKK